MIENTTSIEIWIIKRIVIPIVIVIAIIVAYNHYSNELKCKKICKERGYLEYEYFPSNRAGIGAKCICTGKVDSYGRIDKEAKIVIDLD